MATNPSKNNGTKAANLFTSPISPSAKTQIEKQFESSSKRIARLQDDLGKDELASGDTFEKVSSSIASSVSKTFSRLNITGSNDVSSVNVDNMFALARRQTDSSGAKSFAANKKLLQKAKNEVTAANRQQLNNMLETHKRNFTDRIATYNMIIKIIPKMRLALNTFANTIISPDDFTKQSISVTVEQNGVTETAYNSAMAETAKMLQSHSLAKEAKEHVVSYLVNGKLFFLVTSMNKELAGMLNESSKIAPTSIYRQIKSRDYSMQGAKFLTESAIDAKMVNHQVLEEHTEFCEAFGIVDKADPAAIAKSYGAVDDFIQEHFYIGNSTALLSDVASMEDSMKGLSEYFTADQFSRTAVRAITPSNADEGLAVTEKQMGRNNRAIVRRISPANIVSLDFEGKNYGYIHLDIVEIDPDNHVLPVDNGSEVEGMGGLPTTFGASNNGSMIQGLISSTSDTRTDGNNNSTIRRNVENPSESPGLGGSEDARLKFMAAAFANKFSKDANIKLLRKNESLRQAIYNGLAIKKISSTQKVRVVYLKPEEVVCINRGHSIFDNILFFAKLYIATLVTILLQNVLRGGEQRVVYVEVGNDNNGAHAVQQVIRDLKSREISSIFNMDLQSVLNIHSQFNDYFIPVVDGEKPVTFDTLSPLDNKTIDDEFLTWLSNNIFSGIGLPAAYLTEVENIDFAKSLSMQNSRFLRDCIAEQAILSNGFTELIRKIYAIESSPPKSGANSDSEDDGSAERYVSPDRLSIIFPAPAALSLINIGDQLSSAGNIIDTLVNNLDLSDIKDENRDAIKDMIKSKIMRRNVSSFNWQTFDDDVTACKEQFNKMKIVDAIKTAATDVSDNEGEDNLDDDGEDI